MNDRPMNQNHPSRLELESWLNGDSGAGPGNLDAHLHACPDCAARVKGMRAQGDRFRFRNPSFAALSARRRRPLWPRRLLLMRPGRSAAVLATLALAAAGTIMWAGRPAPEPSRDLKGAPAFLLFDSRKNRLDPRDTVKVRDGDTLQLAVVSESPIRYRIFSRAENGALKQLLPLPGEADSLGAALKGAALPHSLIFTAPIAPERIICVWSRHSLDGKSARDLLSAGGAPSAAGADSFQVVGVP